MNVGLVTQNNYPDAQEVRNRKLAKALDRRGHDVHIFARNRISDPNSGERGVNPPVEHLPYAQVTRFSALFPGRLHSLISQPIPVNPAWAFWLSRQFLRHDVDVAVVGDIRLGFPSLLSGRFMSVPVIVDLRENYQEWARLLERKTLVEKIERNPTLVGAIETTTIQAADGVWVVSDERVEEVVDEGANPDTTWVIRNTPYLPEFDAERESSSEQWANPDKFTFVYIGMLDEWRNLDRAVSAMAILTKSIQETELILAGEGPVREELIRQAQELGIESHVSLPGWIDPIDVPSLLRACDAGIIPFQPDPHTDTTIPNKVFDYMAAGLPIVSTDATAVSRTLNEADCGVVVNRPATPKSFARALKTVRDEKDARDLGQNARTAVEQRYNWGTDMDTVLQSFRRVLSP